MLTNVPCGSLLLIDESLMDESLMDKSPNGPS